MNFTLRRCETTLEFAAEACGVIRQITGCRVEEKGFCTMALSGGRAARMVYQQLASDSKWDDVPWNRIHFFWSDERCLPPDSPDSNFSLALEMLSRRRVPAGNIHHPAYGAAPSETVAAEYEDEIRGFFARHDTPDDTPPVFDLVLLGMGEDGHTASLFPGDDILLEEERWVSAVLAPDYTACHHRITFTLPLINSAAECLMLVLGEGKEKIMEDVLADRKNLSKSYPAAMVSPRERLTWVVMTGGDLSSTR